jgi:hypothetical protein
MCRPWCARNSNNPYWSSLSRNFPTVSGILCGAPGEKCQCVWLQLIYEEQERQRTKLLLHSCKVDKNNLFPQELNWSMKHSLTNYED